MTAVLQRVYHATVYADGVRSGDIGAGLYILLGVESGDTEEDVVLLSEKILKLRIFADEKGKMNLSVLDINGDVMIVPNFTLCANYAHGNRPDYLSAEKPAEACRLFRAFTDAVRQKIPQVACGVFGADMRTDMSTDGPITIVMQSEILRKSKAENRRHP